MTIEDRDIMGGLAKGLSVIETFSAERPRQTISQVAEASGLDRATARRCLLTLAKSGYADWDGKFFTLTPRVLRLGTACLATMPLPQIVQPHLDRLSEEIGQSTSVSILDGADIVYVARAAQRKVMSIALMPGSRLPAYCTSMGRVLLSALPENDARLRLGSSPLPARTQYTLTNHDTVMVEIARVRTQGFAIIDQEVEVNLQSLAVPLFNVWGKTVAALNVGVAGNGPADDLIKYYLELMRAVQSELRQQLT
jgi:IclR family transcriptional regulator, pca regulon regulatory protein